MSSKVPLLTLILADALNRLRASSRDVVEEANLTHVAEEGSDRETYLPLGQTDYSREVKCRNMEIA